MKREHNIKPPRLATALLEWYCANASIEDLQGDLDELFYANLQRTSVFNARLKFWLQVLSLVTSYAIRKRKQKSAFHPYSHSPNHYAMLRSYLTIGFRNLLKNKSYSVVNISGLAVAVAVSLIIVLFIAQEFRYDAHHANADRIYRVHYEKKFGSNHAHMAAVPAVTGHSLQQDFPEVESSVRFINYGTYLVKTNGATENIKESYVLWTDSTFFRVFSVPLVAGNPAHALAQPYSVAISRRMAEKYFAGTTALGKTLVLDDRYTTTVTAVFENIPTTSHFHADILISLAGDWPAAREAKATTFANNNFNTYILLKHGTSAQALEAKLPAFVEKFAGPPAPDKVDRLTLMPLRHIHLHSNLRGELEPNGSITYVYLFALVAAFIVVVACINFMNLATAHAGRRAKEIGVRKVMGSLRSHLMRQFLLESFIITLAAFFVAVGLAHLLLPLFNTILQTELMLPFQTPFFYGALFAGALFVGVLAGAYPAFYLSGFSPVNVLKGKLSAGLSKGYLRSGLVVFQFVTSIVLIVAALTVNQQLDFIQNKNLGFEKDHVLLVKDVYVLRPNTIAFKNEVEKISAISHCTISAFVPVEGGSEFPRRDRTFWKEGSAPSGDNLVSLQQWSVDADYIATFNMQVLQGRGLSNDFASDSAAVVLNKAALRQLDLGANPIGKTILTFTGYNTPDFDHPKAFVVVGVIDDFHFSSLKETIAPLALFLGRSDGFLSVRFAGNPQPVIEALEKKWKQSAPGQPFQYVFLDEEFGKMYASEQRLGKMFGIFATLAIVIACFGLFALSAYTAKQRTKEIGIRKVMGASVRSIIVLLSAEFSKLLVVAFVIAIPLAWFGMEWWLQNFSYRVALGVSVFAVAASLVMCIACLTTWYHSYQAASSDPIKSIRTE
ncbi:ABC transporter permease [Chryseolinea lacunae]|uniref:ABC transporter permease n=1 Tax=Chryseolinea lacunae TaxID=2801331 RepID=A0ABS1KRP4_9BACT|nr:ABC transporter permease [Chryseolinea lacunae]MBL0741932.1 ABC transporter permease [Chryseolinea lacunae]